MSVPIDILFRKDPLQGSGVTLVSSTPDGGQPSRGSGSPSLSADGKVVAFNATGAGLHPSGREWGEDVYVRRGSEMPQCASLTQQGEAGNEHSRFASLSEDGRRVAFESRATNLVDGDTNHGSDIFVWDADRKTLQRASRNDDWSSTEPSLSGDGRLVAFTAGQEKSCQVVLRDLDSGLLEEVSVDARGVAGDGRSGHPSVSYDGRRIAFETQAPRLSERSGHQVTDIVARDRHRGRTWSLTGHSDLGSSDPAISADGRYVAFASFSTNLVAGDTNGKGDIFVADLDTGHIERVSIGPGGREADDNCYSAAISGDGRFVVFTSRATTLVAETLPPYPHIFVHDRKTGETAVVDRTVEGHVAQGESYAGAISADGSTIAFVSGYSGLAPNDTNRAADVFTVENPAPALVRERKVRELENPPEPPRPPELERRETHVIIDGVAVPIHSPAR